jgi:hypothetical protein
MFTCEECNKIYTYKANYIRHIDKHKQHKPMESNTESDFIIINNSYFDKKEDKKEDKDTIIINLKKQIEDYIIKCNQLELELKKINNEYNELKENKDLQILNFFNNKVHAYSGIMIPSKYNQLFFNTNRR